MQGDCADPIVGRLNRKVAEPFPALEIWLNAGHHKDLLCRFSN
jgi:hypothetical protein